MARLWSSGFELNTTGTDVEWSAQTGSPVIQTTTVRSGTYAGQITGMSSATRMAVRYDVATAGLTQLFFRTYFRVATLPSAENRIIGLSVTSNTAHTVYITLDNGGLLALFDEDGQIGSDSGALSLNTWYMIDILWDKSGASGSHIIRARIDGVEFAGAANRTIGAASVSSLVLGGNLNAEAQTTGNWYFDDVAINNASGSFQNSYPGEGEIIHLRPNAAGDNNAWLKNGGAAGDANNFNQLDEVTPDNGTTNLETSGVLDATDDYNMDATPAAMDSGDIINVVQVGYVGRAESAGDADGVVLRIKAAAAGTVEEGSLITMNGTTWKTNANADPRNYTLTLYDLPGASTTAWTKSDLDQAQIGMKSNDAGAVAGEASALWLLVDHKPAPPSGGTTFPGYYGFGQGFN